MRMFCTAAALLLAAVAIPAPMTGQVDAPRPGAISGRVVDRVTGRPVGEVQVVVIGQASPTASSDQDGRYRLAPLQPGVYNLRAVRIGYGPVRADSVRVTAGGVTALDLVLKGATVQLAEVEVVAQESGRANSEAGLLALQQAAAGASDGVSAELIAKTPDANAAAAVSRVTGVTIVDRKFVYVRGLGERYSNTLLNGVEPVSPEPTRRIVPLDVFPANLIESIVASKTATPDKPGDFAGGSVDIQTREFPTEFTAGMKVSQEYNSQTTFRRLGLPSVRGTDWLGFDNSGRFVPGVTATGTTGLTEAQAEGFRMLWRPAPIRIAPNAGLSANVGGQLGAGGRTPIGYVFALNYGIGASAVPDRLFRYGAFGIDSTFGSIRDLRESEASRTVDWGGIANLTFKLGANNKIGLKNFYTRNAEETFTDNVGVDQELPSSAPVRTYQARYIERSVYQGVLSGLHRVHLGTDVIIEWKSAAARARRDEPENRRLRYFTSTDGPDAVQPNAPFNTFFINLNSDESFSNQVDVGVPVSLRQSQDALVKVGGLVRRKTRLLDPASFALVVRDPTVSTLDPEQLTSPENLVGTSGSTGAVQLSGGSGGLVRYRARDYIRSGYAMLDAFLVPGLRFVGGARLEEWSLDLATQDPNGNPLTFLRRNRDVLWSANLTQSLGERLQLRLAGFRSVARPDPREISLGFYNEVVGSCNFSGDSSVTRTNIINGDARLEFYPRPGEILAVSGFYKDFDRPIVEFIGTPAGSCLRTAANAKRARNYGAEFELRKRLDVLGRPFDGFTVGANVTVVQSRADLGPLGGNRTESFAGQSPYVINGSLGFDGGPLRASLSYNRFGERITQYGQIRAATGTLDSPTIYEQPRNTLDAKADVRLTSQLTLGAQGRNLLNADYVFLARQGPLAEAVRRYRLGWSFGMSVGYAF